MTNEISPKQQAAFDKYMAGGAVTAAQMMAIVTGMTSIPESQRQQLMAELERCPDDQMISIEDNGTMMIEIPMLEPINDIMKGLEVIDREVQHPKVQRSSFPTNKKDVKRQNRAMQSKVRRY